MSDKLSFYFYFFVHCALPCCLSLKSIANNSNLAISLRASGSIFPLVVLVVLVQVSSISLVMESLTEEFLYVVMTFSTSL